MYLHRYPLGLMVFILSLFCSCELGKDTEKKAREAQEENRRKQERSIEYEQALLEYRELRAKNERIDQEMAFKSFLRSWRLSQNAITII